MILQGLMVSIYFIMHVQRNEFDDRYSFFANNFYLYSDIAFLITSVFTKSTCTIVGIHRAPSRVLPVKRSLGAKLLSLHNCFYMYSFMDIFWM